MTARPVNALDNPPPPFETARAMPRVVIEQLRKTFPLTKGRSVCAVNDLNLTVEAGEFLEAGVRLFLEGAADDSNPDARIEARMIQDKVRVPGWFIECSDDSAPAFLRCGFAPVPLDYRPPLVGNLASARATDPEPMHLLYKTFGPVFTPPALTRSFVLQALHEILRGVYGQAKPQRSFTYLRARQSLAGADWA